MVYSEAMVIRKAQKFSCFVFVTRIRKFKRPIQTFEHDLHIELFFEIKIYIFFEIFCYFLDGYKIASFGWCRNR
jgi:hypothetical protein